jgi:hypothetical protein
LVFLKKILILIIAIVIYNNSKSQVLKTELLGTAADMALFKQYQAKTAKLNTIIELNEFVNTSIAQLRKGGYLAASVDSLVIINDTAYIKIFCGYPLKWAKLRNFKCYSMERKTVFKYQLQPSKICFVM